VARLTGKTCIVTGAASGIGWQTARHFADEDATVAAFDVNEAGLDELKASNPRISTKLVDVTDAGQVRRSVEDLDKIDVLFNCAGRVPVGTILDCSETDWQSAFDLNVSSLYHLTKVVLPKMIAQKGGSIINMASVISSIGGVPDRFAYGTTKAAVIGMTKSIAKDFAHTGVRCNAICPSSVETPSMSARIDAMDDPETARAAFSMRQPVGRMGTPEEIAQLATYLASDESRFMTGSAIVIDGGAKI
jgi:NAD(P)-dependent dehydrogenase (short-subunit alcohol dehydrogenase family)